MKKRKILSLISLMMAIIILPISFLELPFSAKAQSKNLALGKPAYSSGDEVDWLTPNLAVDGTISLPSRWSSTYEDNAWFYVDLGEEKPINKVIVRWQTPAVRYKIQISNNAVDWENVLPNDGIITTEQQWDEVNTIDFSIQTARYVKFQGVQAKPDHGYGFYEFEVYGDVGDVDKIAESIKTVNPISKNDEKITLPSVPSGYSVKLYGSDKKPIIDLEGNITTPLTDTEVHLLFEVVNDSDNTQKAVTGNVLVTVPGLYTETAELNTKPYVLPTLQEWHGRTGNITIGASSRIVVRAADKALLEETAKVTKEDLKVLTKLDLPIAYGEPSAGDIYLSIDPSLTTLGKEGYLLDADSYVSLCSIDSQGVFYGTRTVLQILKQNLDTLQIPKGISRDYPKDETRGIMLDVARKFYTIEYLRDYVKLLSWYKMNFFQIHLNDDVYSPFDPGWAFRLECETYPGLTSSAESGFYTKEEFRDLQLLGMDYGVNIVPEIDSPGHSGAYIAYDPSLGSDTHLDLENPKALEFIKSLFDEYMDGPNPTFIGPNVHIGTDEYNTKNAEDVERFRSFTNSLIEHINSKGKQPHFWGSLSQYAGTTPISTDATIDIWASNFGGVKQAVDLGYDVLNFENNPLYIVPVISEALDYMNIEKTYKTWKTETFNDYTLPYGHPQMKGTVTALWNDWSASRGVSMDDSHDRLFPAIQLVSEKSWYGTNEDMDYEKYLEVADKVGEAPGANLSHRVDVTTEDKKVVEYRFENNLNDESGNQYNGSSKNVFYVDGKLGQGIKLNGGESYVETPVNSVGFGWTASMWIKPDLDSPSEGILLDSPAGKLILKAGKDKVKARDFNDVFGSNIAFVDSENGLKVTTGDMGQRISSTKKHLVDGLTFKIKDITVQKPQNDQNVYLAFTLADEHGHYHAAGAKGIHFRLMTDKTGKLYFYIQKADVTTESGEGVYRAMLPLEGFNDGMPDDITVRFRKSGDKFVISINNVETEIPYSVVENLLPSGKAHVVFGGWSNGYVKKNISYTIENLAFVSKNMTDQPSGKLVFAKEKYETSFDYAVPLGQWTHILLTGTNNGTSLYINGDEYTEHIEEFGGVRILNTFVLPLKYIGSPTSAFKGVIDNVVVYDKRIDLLNNINNLALHKPTKASSVEVPQFGHGNAVDKSLNTRWSSLPQNDSWFSVDLEKEYSIEKLIINWEAAVGKSFKILVSSDEKNWTNVLENDGVFHGFIGRQTLNFKSIQARYVKLQGVETAETYLGYSFYEFEVYGSSVSFTEYNKAVERAAQLLGTKKGEMAIRNEIEALANLYPYQNDAIGIAQLNALLNSLQKTIPQEPGNPDDGRGALPTTGDKQNPLALIIMLITFVIGVVLVAVSKRRKIGRAALN